MFLDLKDEHNFWCLAGAKKLRIITLAGFLCLHLA